MQGTCPPGVMLEVWGRDAATASPGNLGPVWAREPGEAGGAWLLMLLAGAGCVRVWACSSLHAALGECPDTGVLVPAPTPRK